MLKGLELLYHIFLKFLNLLQGPVQPELFLQMIVRLLLNDKLHSLIQCNLVYFVQFSYHQKVYHSKVVIFPYMEKKNCKQEVVYHHRSVQHPKIHLHFLVLYKLLMSYFQKKKTIYLYDFL